MYLFKSSFLKVDNVYRNVDLTDVRMSYILDKFSDGYIELTHTILSGLFYITLEDLRQANVLMSNVLSFHDWLALNNNKELPTKKDKPKYNINTVKYSDAIQAGFSINQVGEYLPIDANVSRADKHDLVIDKNIADKEVLYRRLLVSVNGFLHKTYWYDNKVMIRGGGDTFNATGINTVGVLSFYDSCDLTQIAINENMIIRASSTIPLYQEVLINTGETLVSKSVMLSLGGYLIFIGKALDIINHEVGVLQLKIDKLDIAKLILNSVDAIDLSSLGIFSTNQSIDYNKVKMQDILSDILIKKYLLLKQSFIIIADCDHVEVTHEDVGISGIPGLYETKTEPKLPMINSRGVMCEYWKTRNGTTWSIRLTDDITKRYIHKTNLDIDNVTINSISPTYNWYHDDPRLLKINTIIKSHI